jgi:hypothetical protein
MLQLLLKQLFIKSFLNLIKKQIIAKHFPFLDLTRVFLIIFQYNCLVVSQYIHVNVFFSWGIIEDETSHAHLNMKTNKYIIQSNN